MVEIYKDSKDTKRETEISIGIIHLNFLKDGDRLMFALGWVANIFVILCLTSKQIIIVYKKIN